MKSVTTRNGRLFLRPGLFLLLALIPAAAPAGTVEAPPEPTLRLHPSVNLPLTAITMGAALGAELRADDLAPDECRWCDWTANGRDDLNSFDSGVRDALAWGNPDRARTLSNVTLAGTVVTTLAAQKLSARPGEFWTNALLIAEAAGITGVLTQVTKYTVGRQRPRAHLSPLRGTNWLEEPEADDNLSFFSGHTAGAFAVAVAGGRIASLRGYGHPTRVWAAGLSLAALTGYLRVAADEHYATDVLTGAAVGAAVGWLVPGFHRAPVEPEGAGWTVEPSAAPGGGAGLRLQLRW